MLLFPSVAINTLCSFDAHLLCEMPLCSQTYVYVDISVHQNISGVTKERTFKCSILTGGGTGTEFSTWSTDLWFIRAPPRE